MPRRAGRALGAVAGALVLALVLAAAHTTMQRRILPEAVSVLALEGLMKATGGWSGIEVSDDGRRIWLISDQGWGASSELARDGAGALARLTGQHVFPLQDARGDALREPYHDTEGLVRLSDGSFAVSREWQHGVSLYTRLDGPAGGPLAPDPLFIPFGGNSGLEALAVDADGRLITIAERPPDGAAETPLYLGAPGAWTVARLVPRGGQWSVTGADCGPDGQIYLLERRFLGLGFEGRIRALDLGRPDAEPQILYHAPLGRHGNLEGLALWRDGAGDLRALMVSDDNRWQFQRAELVEAVLVPLAAAAPRS